MTSATCPAPHPDDSAVHAPGLRTTDFGGLVIAFDDRVLTPRPWTQAHSAWAEELQATLPPGPVLELCAGAGQIGLLAVARTRRSLVCVDADPVALAFAGANALAAGMADRVELREHRLTGSLGTAERFPLVIADPPWVSRAETGRYPEDPLTAIDGGDDGLEMVRTCVATIDRHLCDGGVALLQVGTPEQRDEVASWRGTRVEVTDSREYPGQGVLVRLDRR